MAFVFAGILCFIAAGCAVVAWGLAKAEATARAQSPTRQPEKLQQAA
jgi:hypothetical protein